MCACSACWRRRRPSGRWPGVSRAICCAAPRLDQFEGWAAGSAMALTQDEHAYLEASLEDRREREAA